MKIKCFFVALEGIDGAGKSSLSNRLISHFGKTGIYCHSFPEFNNTILKEKIRDIVHDNWINVPYLAQIFLIAADKICSIVDLKNHFEDRDKIIIADRFLETMIVYQQVSMLLQKEKKSGNFDALINTVMDQYFFHPNLVLYLDIRTSTALKRGQGDFVSEKFLNQARKLYHKRLKMGKYFLIDGEQKMDNVFDDAVRIISENYQSHLIKMKGSKS